MKKSAMTKKTVSRTFIACNSCRELKLKCLNEGDELVACQRCHRFDLKCTYTPTSSQLRKKQLNERKLAKKNIARTIKRNGKNS